MARDIDVFQLLRSFAQRNGLGSIGYRAFAQALQRQAQAADQTEPLYRDLGANPDLILVPRLFLLAKERKLNLEMAGNEIRSILLPERIVEAFAQEYRRMDESMDIPFPGEETIKTPVPAEWIKTVSLDTDLDAVSDIGGEKTVPLFRFLFAEGLKPIVMPSSFVPDKILEYSALKLRHYVRKEANKDYMYNKLSYAFPGKENQLKEALSLALTKPHESIESLRKAESDFAFSFWNYLINVIRKDLEKKGDKTPEDVSIQQAAAICEFYANHYKAKAQRLIDLEAALRSLDVGLRKQPFNFGIDEILSFNDSKGQPLLGKFTQEELEAWLRDKSTRAEAGMLPELLVLATPGRKAFVAKDRALLLALRLITEARADARTRIIERWRRLIEDFKDSAAMREDEAFLAELAAMVEARLPLLGAFLRDRLLPLVAAEAAGKGELPADVQKLFYKGELVPLDELLDISRHGLIADARMLLPFWYSVPILSAFARFFRRLGTAKAGKGRRSSSSAPARPAQDEKPKPGAAKVLASGDGPEKKRGMTAQEKRAEFIAAASKVARELTPADLSLDEYLSELEGRWNTSLNPQAKANLTEDVNSLVRDFLRGIVRNMQGSTLTLARVKSLAASLADSASLSKIKNHQALETYIQLYMTKALGARLTKS